MSKNTKVAIIQVPNLVFFPNTVLPLLIVESSHIKMIQDCIEQNILLGICQDQSEYNIYHGPKVNTICGAGKPLILEKYEDGSMKVLLKGKHRVRLEYTKQNLPYPLFEAIILEDEEIKSELSNSAHIERLKNMFNNWIEETIRNSVEREAFVSSLETLSHYIDYISMYLIQDSQMRQILLENTCLSSRINTLATLLRDNHIEGEDPGVVDAFKEYETLEEEYKKVAH